MLCRPTNVAAASCHALLPESSHLGDGTSIDVSPFFSVARRLTTTGAQSLRGMSGLNERGKSYAIVPTPVEPWTNRVFLAARLGPVLMSFAYNLGKHGHPSARGSPCGEPGF